MGAATFCAPDLSFVHAKVVGHFVPDGFFNELAEVARVPRHALVRALEDGDAVGHTKRFAHTTHGERTPLIQAQDSGARRFRLDDKDDVFQSATETPGHHAHRLFHHTVKFAGMHRPFSL